MDPLKPRRLRIAGDPPEADQSMLPNSKKFRAPRATTKRRMMPMATMSGLRGSLSAGL